MVLLEVHEKSKSQFLKELRLFHCNGDLKVCKLIKMDFLTCIMFLNCYFPECFYATLSEVEKKTDTDTYMTAGKSLT